MPLSVTNFQRGFKLRERLAHSYIGQPMPDSLHLLPSTPQIKGLHTFIRNQDTSRDEFIFYSNRLIRLVIEYALGLMPFKEVKVETPQNIPYEGKRMTGQKICGVSILRAGETMEQAVCDVCKDIRIGKILIQTNQLTGEPEVICVQKIIFCFFFFHGLNFIDSAISVVLFETAKRYKGLSRNFNGCDCRNRCSGNDGHTCSTRLRCTRRKYSISFIANGRNWCSFNSICISKGRCHLPPIPIDVPNFKLHIIFFCRFKL